MTFARVGGIIVALIGTEDDVRDTANAPRRGAGSIRAFRKQCGASRRKSAFVRPSGEVEPQAFMTRGRAVGSSSGS